MRVQSSNIETLEFDPASGLRVRFSNGGAYRYPDVPAHVYFRLLEAPSIGRAFWAEIRSGGYTFIKESASA